MFSLLWWLDSVNHRQSSSALQSFAFVWGSRTQYLHAPGICPSLDKANNVELLASAAITELKCKSVLVEADVHWSKYDCDSVAT